MTGFVAADGDDLNDALPRLVRSLRRQPPPVRVAGPDGPCARCPAVLIGGTWWMPMGKTAGAPHAHATEAGPQPGEPASGTGTLWSCG